MQALRGFALLYYIRNRGHTQMNNIIDVSYPTHGLQAGAQVHYNPRCHTWTVWTNRGLERTFKNVVAYVRFMTRG